MVRMMPLLTSLQLHGGKQLHSNSRSADALLLMLGSSAAEVQRVSARDRKNEFEYREESGKEGGMIKPMRCDIERV